MPIKRHLKGKRVGWGGSSLPLGQRKGLELHSMGNVKGYVSQHRSKNAAIQASRRANGRTRVVQDNNPNSFKYAVKKY